MWAGVAGSGMLVPTPRMRGPASGPIASVCRSGRAATGSAWMELLRPSSLDGADPRATPVRGAPRGCQVWQCGHAFKTIEHLAWRSYALLAS